jgi:hypothetical protein
MKLLCAEVEKALEFAMQREQRRVNRLYRAPLAALCTLFLTGTQVYCAADFPVTNFCMTVAVFVQILFRQAVTAYFPVLDLCPRTR